MTGREVTEVLEKIGELEWGRHPMLSSAPGGLSRPPVVAWRFKLKNDEANEKIARAVASFRGNVEWEALSSSRNWAIAPKRVREIQNKRGYSVDVQALVALELEEPEFGVGANRDLPALARHLEKALGLESVEPEGQDGAHASSRD